MNRILVFAFVSIILTGVIMGSASARLYTFGGCLNTADYPDGTLKYPDNVAGTVMAGASDTVGWYNTYYNHLSYWQYGNVGYSCSILTITTPRINIPAYTERKDQVFSGPLSGSTGTYGVYTINHIYYGNGPTHTTDNNVGVPQIMKV